MDTAAASFNTTAKLMTKTSQQKTYTIQLNLRHKFKAMLATSVWISDKIVDFTMMSENNQPFDLDCK